MENPEETKQQLEEILERREYQAYYEDSRSSLQIWWEEARNWITSQLQNWFSSFEPSDGLANGILLVLIVVGIALVVYLGFKFAGPAERNQTFRDQSPLQSREEMRWSVHSHLTEARKQEEQGAYGPAVRHLFLALLLHFHEKNWLEARIWKTNWEYYEELQQRDKPRAEQFYKLALLFDEVAYGDRSITKEEYESYRNEAVSRIETDEGNQTAGEG